MFVCISRITHYSCELGIALVMVRTAISLSLLFFMKEHARIYDISNYHREQILPGVGRSLLYSTPLEVEDLADTIDEREWSNLKQHL